MITMNDTQQAAFDKIMRIYRGRLSNKVLLTGGGGAGKTTLMQCVVDAMREDEVRIVCVGPTHKSVQVLKDKMQEAGIGIPCMTQHSLMGLKPQPTESENTELKRINKSKSHMFDVVVGDEVSMNGGAMQQFLNEELMHHFALYVGDPAQLPPVGEKRAPIFDMIGGEFHAHLDKIVRQAAGNPILRAADCLRRQQGSTVDWSWLETVEHEGLGMYRAGDDVDQWLRGAFTSEEFAKDNDAFRYLCYTNARVHEVNAKARYWLYGETETPFVPGERVMCRNPIMDRKGRPAFQTNEEALVANISKGTRKFFFEGRAAGPDRREVPQWSYELPVWKVQLVRNEAVECEWYDTEESGDSDDVIADIPMNNQEYDSIVRRLVSEAKANKGRWRDHFYFKDQIADLRPVYAMTIHSSQGSTFDRSFIDIPDCVRRIDYNLLETQQLLYVAVTRARYQNFLVGV